MIARMDAALASEADVGRALKYWSMGLLPSAELPPALDGVAGIVPICRLCGRVTSDYKIFLVLRVVLLCY
jgi:hypothetical protein